MRLISKIMLLPACLILIGLASCDDTQSYSDLLNDEEHAVNWYLAQHNVYLDIPEDGNFITAEDVEDIDELPYYKMDGDGYVYMQVINKGSETMRPKEGDLIYFRFMRMSLLTYQSTGEESWDGNSEDLEYTSSSLVYGNTVLTSTTQYGDGIQVPLEYLGYNSEVNLVIKSPEGFTTDQSYCIPYVYNVRYFKAEY